MIIIVEGNEGTGKTTLINQIMREMPLVYIKYPKEVKCTHRLYLDLLNTNQNIIFDRSFISDMVYRCWDKNSTQMTLSEIAGLLEYYNEQIKIIFCHNDSGFKCAESRGEDYITDISTYEIIERNYEVIENLIKAFTNVECLDYNFNYMSTDDVLKFIRGKKDVDRSKRRG